MDRPNFLLIMTDQQRADHLGCSGHRVLQTPNIDSIADRGVTFDRFYVATPICMPNRATLMTGRMPSVHGVRHNGIPLSLRATTFVELMRQAGYRTAMVGKSHLQNMLDRPPLVPDTRDPALAKPPPELDEASQAEPGRYDQEYALRWRRDPERTMDLPYYGFETVDLAIQHADQVDGHYTGWLAERRWDRRFSSAVGAMLTGNVVIYLFGLPWLAHVLHTNLEQTLQDGLYPFVPGDTFKLYLAAAALPGAWKLVGRLRQ